MLKLTCKGQSTLEYGLIAGLVSLCAMGALVLLSDQLSLGFNDILSNRNASTAAPVSQVSNASAAGNSGLTGVGGLGTVAFTLSNGMNIKLTQYPVNNKEMIETTGANGLTTALANNLEMLVTQLQAADALNASQASTLMKLANQGHKIAEVQKLLEEMAAKSSDASEFNKMQVMLDGQAYSSTGLVAKIGYMSGPEELQGDEIFNTGDPGVYTVDLLSAYNEAMASGALQDPVVKQVVTALTKQIAMSSEITQHVSYPVAYGGEPIDQFAQLQQAASTHLNSLGICQQGNGTDSGVQCSSN